MKLKCFLIMSFILVLYSPSVFSYNDTTTHKDITKTSIDKFEEINDYFKSILGFKEGSNEPVNETTITKLIQEGSTNEDHRNRAYNHFYNPLNGEGLDDYPFPLFRLYGGKSSNCGSLYKYTGIPALGWALGSGYRSCGAGYFDEDNYNGYSWIKARESYYNSFFYPELRDYYLISFFEQFGRVLHMLEDMSVPAHVRNDMLGHLTPKGLNYIKDHWDVLKELSIVDFVKHNASNNYENWVEINKKQSDIIAYKDSTEHPLVIPKFATPQQYWDNDVYNSSNPNPEDTLATDSEKGAGLSEYTNANFVSTKTIFSNNNPESEKKRFPYPRTSSMDREYPAFISRIQAEDGKYDNIPLLNKVRDGEIVDKGFIGVKYLAYPLKSEAIHSERVYFFNPAVHSNYADILIPKTIAYTAGLIDYFFRGRMGIVPKFSGYDAESQMFKKVTVAATNDSKWIDDRIEPMPY
ncbi:MAG TPA: hypothetical protein VIO64_10480, partial [Pseudobacteroides sp.]|uniref:hypothetical protein n=1 Tax=Pseudobacteroides sp. TaxID=1968840 RepID=UPI002F95E7AF